MRFILDHEPALAACEKRWIVNRILDPEEEARILDLLARHDQPVLHLPFDAEAFARAGWSTHVLPDPELLAGPGLARLDPAARERLALALRRDRNAALMHNNGGRNAALADGRGRARWILPWDGNCFVPAAAWEALRSAVAAEPWRPAFTVPMARITDNARLLDPAFTPEAAEEPQIVLRADTDLAFDPAFVYGRRPKVELFWRLGIPGPWDAWPDDPWDPPRAPFAAQAGQAGTAGWVARLASGRADLETPDRAGFLDRGAERRAAIRTTLDAALDRLAPPEPDALGLACYASAALDTLDPDTALARALIAEAETALTREPLSVTAKTTLPPSGNRRDYWHPAPYWWPNGLTPSGRPYRRRDGKRVPGTRMYEPESGKYDRTRLQYLFDDTVTLALAARLTGRADLAARAVANLESWFIDPATAMTPHLRYAQVRPGWNRDEGVGTGIIEFKDVHCLLDAVRLLDAAGALPAATRTGLETWLAAYLDWLLTSRAGAHERAARNNHGTYYDLQVGAIAAWLGDRDTLRDTLIRAQSRLVVQITPDGDQPHEMTRADTAHYCFFNLSGWVALMRLGRRSGLLHPAPDRPPFDRLAAALARTLGPAPGAWPHRQKGAFDPERGAALALHGHQAGLIGPGALARHRSDRPRFDPHDGIPPWWRLTGPLP